MSESVGKLVEDSAKTLQDKLRQIDEKYRVESKERKVRNPYPTLKGVACIPYTKNHISTIA